MKHEFTFDGFGINDATNEYKPRVATLKPNYQTKEIGDLLAAAPALLEALEALWLEVQLSDNARAINDGWPNAVKLTRAAIKLATN